MHVPMNVKSPNNTSKWQMGINSAFKWLIHHSDRMAYGEQLLRGGAVTFVTGHFHSFRRTR
jgi:hypothetical protein